MLRLVAHIRGDTDVIVVKRLAPDIALLAGVRAVFQKLTRVGCGVVGGSLVAHVAGHAHMIVVKRLAPDIALLAGVWAIGCICRCQA